MLVLHGTWIPDWERFALWGESLTTTQSPPRGRRNRFSPHLFSSRLEQVAFYARPFLTQPQFEAETLPIWLPGSGKNPQPSPQAQAAGLAPLEPNDLSLLGWQVPTLTLNPTDTLDFLLQVTPDSQLHLGADVRYWQQAALVVINSLVEGRFIPTITKTEVDLEAAWELRPEPQHFSQLSRQMPPLCRAVCADPANPLRPSDLLGDFFHQTLNSFIHDYYQPHPLAFPKRLFWLRSFTQPPAPLPTFPKLKQVYQDWQSWQVPTLPTEHYRVCLRLTEPAFNSETWRVEYLLQAHHDPSLMVEAEQVWLGQSDILRQHFPQASDKLLTALGTAARLFEPIETSLRQARPTGAELTTAQAHQFLRDILPQLEGQGLGVIVPNWWQKTPRLKARAKLKGQTDEPTGILSREALIQYDWELSVGGEALSPDEFEALVELKQPLVRHRGEWLVIDPQQAAKVLEQLRQQQSRDLTLLEALQVTAEPQLATSTQNDTIEIDSLAVEGWLADLLAQLQQPEASTVPPIPSTLNATLRPYQARGLGWLIQMRRLGLGACLADDMGLGKTIQVISLWLHEREHAEQVAPALLVCPTSVVGNWGHELARFAPSLKIYKHQGADRLRGENFHQRAERVDVVLTSYALLHRDLDTLQQVRWSSAVLDEAQNIKNPSTKQAQAARALPADYRLALTGTPVENRLTELWSLFQFLNPGYLGSMANFRASFVLPIERYQSEPAAHTLKQLTKPFLLRRVKTDPNIAPDLPEKFENKVYCSLTSEQATLYEAVVREELEQIDAAESDFQRRGNILRMLTRLKQICNHPAQFAKETGDQLHGRSGKLSRLVEMLDEVREQGERALIFTQYAEWGGLLQQYLAAIWVEEVLFLHGGTPAPARDEMVRRFQSSSGPNLFLLSLKAGGTGLNLTNANHVFHFDRWYNPAVENQATDRAFRIGQTKNVQVHKFICLGTLEEKIDDLIEHKQALADQIVGEGESWLTELNSDDLHQLVSLRREVMEEG